MRWIRTLAAVAAAALAAAALAACRADDAAPTSPEGSISILSPSSGSLVEAGAVVPVDVLAVDGRGIVRLELWVDGEMQDTAPSPAEEPARRLQAALFWTPPSPRSYSVTVRAYDWRDSVLATMSQDIRAFAPEERQSESGGAPAEDSSRHAGAVSAGIRFFRGSAQEAVPGETVTLEWSVTGARSAELIRRAADGTPESPVPVGANGSMDVVLHDSEPGGASFTLQVPVDGTVALSETVTIALKCANDWFFEPHPPDCAENPPLVAPAEEQRFEGGTMVYLPTEQRVLVLFSKANGGTWRSYDVADETTDDLDAAVSAPADLFAPKAALGAVWREEPGVRSSLGWATGPRMSFSTTIQFTSRPDENLMFIQSVDGDVYRLDEASSKPRPGVVEEGSGWSTTG